jgi:hypothetical protein
MNVRFSHGSLEFAKVSPCVLAEALQSEVEELNRRYQKPSVFHFKALLCGWTQGETFANSSDP